MDQYYLDLETEPKVEVEVDISVDDFSDKSIKVDNGSNVTMQDYEDHQKLEEDKKKKEKILASRRQRRQELKFKDRRRQLQAELQRRAEMMQNDPVAFEAMRAKERELWKQKKARNNSDLRQEKCQVKVKRKRQELDLDQVSNGHVERFCFICLNIPPDELDFHNQKIRKVSESEKCMKILTFYLVSTAPSSSSTWEESQRNILSSLENGRLSVCGKCLSNGERLLKLHIQLEMIQRDIVNVLKNFQDCIKTSQEISHSHFQDGLLHEFMCSNLTDGNLLRLERLSAAGYGVSSIFTLLNQINGRTVNEDLPASDSEMAPSNSKTVKLEKTGESSTRCFICSCYTSTDHQDVNISSSNIKGSKAAKKILTSYFLQNTSTKQTKEERQGSILTSLRSGNFLACIQCLPKAEKLMKFHLSLEMIQMKILDVLKNLQIDLKSSMRSESETEVQKYFTVDISHFQDILQKEFLSRNLSDGSQVRLERLGDINYKSCSSSLKILETSSKVNDSCERNLSTHELELETGEIDDNDGSNEYHYPDMNEPAPQDCNDAVSDEDEVEGDSNDEDYDPKQETQISPDEVPDLNGNRSEEANHSPEPSTKPKGSRGGPRKKRNGTYKRPKKPGPFSCLSCPKIFHSDRGLRRHKKIHEEGYEEETQCPRCSKILKKISLRNHMKLMHDKLEEQEEEEGIFTCEAESCKKIFRTRSRLDKHIKQIHTEGKGEVFCCASCPKQFRTYLGLYSHKKMHHEEPDLVICPHCPKMFRRHVLCTHIARVHGDKVNPELVLSCQYCCKTFSNKLVHQNHEDAHRAEKKYKCSECPYAAATSRNLYQHKLTHKEKTLTCQLCSKTFRTKSNLKEHERSHTKEKVYKCRFCEKAFSSSSNRITHQKNQHGYVPSRRPLAGIGISMEKELDTSILYSIKKQE